MYGEKHYLGPLHNQMKREPKRLLVKFFGSFTTEVIKNIIGMLSHFILWDGWLYMGPGRVRFHVCDMLVLDSLQVAVDVFEVVVGRCWNFLGGCR